MKTKQQKQVEKKADWSRFLVLIYLIIISILFIANYNRIFDEKIDMNGDNIVYYSLGKSLADGKGYINTIGFEETPHGHFPPGYPAFISVLMKAGISSIHAIKVANGFLLYFSLMLLFFIFADLSKNNLIAFTATAFLAYHSQLLRFATIMMSEILYIFVTALIILIVLKWNVKTIFAERKKLWRDISLIILLSASLAYLYFVRTIGVSLMLAVLFYYGIIFIQSLIKYFRIRWNDSGLPTKQAMTEMVKYAAICGVALISLLAPKMAWDARNIKCFGRAGSNYTSVFLQKEGGGQMETLADWLERLKNNPTNYITNFIPTAIFNSLPDTEKPTLGDWLKGLIFTALMFFALYKSGKKGLVLFLYLGFTFCVLFAYTEIYAGHRHMTPTMPFLVFLFLYGCFEFVKLLIDKYFKVKESKIYAISLSVLVCAIFSLVAQPIYAESMKGIELQAKYKTYNQFNATPSFVQFLQAADWIKGNIPATARIACRKPEIFHIFTDGRKCGNFPFYATPEDILKGFEENKIDYVIIDWWFRHAYHTVVPCIQKYSDKFVVVHQIGGADNQPATYVVRFLHE
ncbi:MAG: hypothetical protein LBR97_03320 [Dysgonamonadaceae bacterium]|jgi:hypothetical protein|nr:hypothetical protein [Dysgonamonadaceae bacterium]